jgi:hypothetical protein
MIPLMHSNDYKVYTAQFDSHQNNVINISFSISLVWYKIPVNNIILFSSQIFTQFK